MLTLNDGRSELWQWDTGRTLAVDADCSQVHFSNKVFGRSIDVVVVDGTAIIPDVLLQTDKDLNVWAFVGTAENGYTKISKTFKVNRRNKPADYVFTQTDQMTLQTIQSQIGDLADLTTEAKDTLVSAINEAARTGGGGGGSTVELDTTLTQIGKAADAAAVGEQLSSLSGKIDNIPSGKDGADGQDGITPTIGENGNWYLGDTDTGKPSRGEPGQDGADGKDGAPGAAGADGYTPVKGTDYFTEAEKQEIAEAAAGMVSIPEKLPNPNALTFTGAIEGTYDGSAPITVDIPNGGGSGGSSGWTGEITELFKLDIEADSNLSLVNLGFPLSDFWNYKEIRIQVKPTTNTSIGWVYLATYDDSKNKTIDIFRTSGASHIWKLRPLGNKVIDSNIKVGNPSVYYFDKGLESYQNHNVDSIQAYIITELQKSQNVCIYPLNAFTIALNITVWGVK